MARRVEELMRRLATHRRLAFVALVSLLLSGLGFVVPGPAEARGSVEFVGLWPEAGNGAVVADGPARHILSFGNTLTGMRVTAFSGNRVELGHRDLDPYVVGNGPGDPIVSTFDEGAHRLYLLVYPSAAERQAAANARLLVIDTADASTLNVVSDLPVSVFPPGVRYLGMSRSAGDGRLELVGQTTTLGFRAFSTLIGEIDLGVGGASVTVTSGPTPVRGCENVVSTTDPAAVVKIGGTVYLGCGTTSAFGGSLPGSAAVAAIDLANPSQPNMYFLPGTYGQAESYFDAAAGEDGRLLLVGSSAGKPGQAVWVFDIRHRVMVGQIGAGEIYGGGVDPGNGRLYVAVKGSLQLSSDRGRVIPQAVSFDDVHPLPSPIRVIPFNRTVIALITGPDGQPVWAVYKDTTPADLFVPANGRDFSVNDAKASETPQFEGDAQAFGFRVHGIGGANAVLTNTTGQPLAWWGAVGSATGLKDGDRDLHFATIGGAHVSSDEASGTAVSLHRDQNSSDDYATAASGPWPFTAATCGDFGGKATTSTGANPSWAPGPVPTAACDQRAGKVAVTSDYGGAGVSGLVVVGSSSSSASLTREANGGVAIVSHAEAHNVTIGGIVKIGEIVSEARVTAFGGAAGPTPARVIRGTASATYVPHFEHVSAPGFSCGSVCPANDVLAALTAALGAQFQVELPAAEALHTSRGAHAHAWREPWGHQQDVVLINQPLTETQVPALRISYIGDNVLPSRVILEFAATKADATSIFVGPDDQPPPAVESGGSAGVAPALPVGGALLPASDVSTPGGGGDGSTASAPGLVTRLIRRLGQGWRWLFAGDFGSLGKATGVWMILATPLFLAARRRFLLRLIRPAHLP